MIRLNVDLTDDLRRKAEARAIETGHASLENYVETLLRADAEGVEEPDFGAPGHLCVASDAELESLLLGRLDDSRPNVEANDEFWSELGKRAQRPEGR